MKICHVCGNYCEDTVTMCTVCGAELSMEAPQSEPRETSEVEEISDAVLVASVEDVVTAEIYKDVLSDNGIHFMSESTSGGMRVTFGGGFSAENIYVSEQDLNTAKTLYNQVLESEENSDMEDFEEL